MPDDAVRNFRPDRRSAVIALTHDPKLDDLALLEALEGAAFHVGAIGSRRNQRARRAGLAEHFDLTHHQLQRLRGPIGLHIDNKTSPEIAVSVMAEILAVKNGVHLPWADIAAAKDKKLSIVDAVCMEHVGGLVCEALQNCARACCNWPAECAFAWSPER